MSARSWTNAQQAAIEDRGGAVVVSAAAGSGKTSVLVERALRLICDEGAPADSLLIMTFTNAAAAELRGRLSFGIQQRLHTRPGDAFLRRQRLLIQRAPIGTVDSYCLRLVKENFTLLQLPPDIETGTRAQLLELEEAALAQTLEEMCADEDFTAFSGMYGQARSDKEAGKILLSMYRWLQSEPDPRQRLQALVRDYESEAPLCRTAWGRLLLQEAGEGAAYAASLTEKALGIVRGQDALLPYENALLSIKRQLETLRGQLHRDDWDAARETVQGFVFERFGVVRGYDGADAAWVKQLRDEVKKQLKKLEGLLPCTAEEYEEDRHRALPMVRAVTTACRIFMDKLWTAKLEAKTLDFSDFEHLALRLLQEEAGGKTPLAQELAARYTAVMVDEYQDTNPLQEQLYRQLAAPHGENLFYVGDVKQSIYRFRQARPELFIQKINEALAAEKAHPRLVRLEENFRSLPGVTGSVNDLFYRLMSRELGDVDYTAEEALKTGIPDRAGGETTVALIPQDAEGGDAAWVAGLAEKLVREGYSVRGEEGLRPVKYDDICVLLRSVKGKTQQYLDAFEKRGVPLYAGGEENFLTAPETQPLLAALRVIDNPALDVPLAAALLSPMFDFTPDDLTRIRLASPGGSLYEALLAGKGGKETRFLELLSRLRLLAVQRPVRALCGLLLQETGYDAVTGAMPGGAARRENLRAFLRFAARYQGKDGLPGFLRMTDNALQAGTDTGAAALAPSGMVRLTSIHRSKGLEFPVCIVADMGKRFNLQDANAPVLLHHELGLGLNLRGEGGLYHTAAHTAVARRLTAEQKSEEMRIFYVALTRAKDALFLSIPAKEPQRLLEKLCLAVEGAGIGHYQLRSMNSMGEWTLCALLTHPDGARLWPAGAPRLLPAEGRLHLWKEEEPALSPQTKTQAAAPDETLLNRLRASFAQAAQRPPLQELPLKMSVSQLSHKDFQPVLRRPSFLYKSGLSATERGSAAHLFLQVADLAAAKRDLESEIERLKRMEYLDGTCAAQLERGKLQRFLESPLCARMLGAEKLLREYDFITTLPAALYSGENGMRDGRGLYVQGIADCILINGSEAELVDYKTDRGKTPAQLKESYTTQLRLYRRAVEKRLAVRVTKGIIYSFELEREIVVFEDDITALETQAQDGKPSGG